MVLNQDERKKLHAYALFMISSGEKSNVVLQFNLRVGFSKALNVGLTLLPLKSMAVELILQWDP